VPPRLPEKGTSAPKKRYAVVRFRGRNDADERQQTKTAAEMRLQNRQRRFKPMKKGELRELYQMMFPEYPDIVTVKELREMLGISRKLAYKLIDYGYIHAVKIGTTLKIPKISVINYVMEKEVEKVG
jgi:excisionase family DNA binding protein